MVGRRQLREKVLQNLYSYTKNELEINVAKKNMFKGIEKIYELYIYQLSFFLALRKIALEKIELNKNKNFASEEELNPNYNFVNNRFFTLIENNKDFKTYIEKHKNLDWENDYQYPLAVYKKLIKSMFYKELLDNPSPSFEDDKKFIVKIFNKYMAENESLHDRYEDLDMEWADDFHIANAMTLKTLKFIQENQSFDTLLSVLKDKNDEVFVSELFTKTIENKKYNLDILKEKAQNWDIDRIAEIDKLIIQMALTEMNHFVEIPTRVIINEYIELAKVFSTPNSNSFINGILDNISKEKNRV